MFDKSKKESPQVPDDPRVLAKMIEVHSAKMVKLRQIQAAKMRAVNARKHAVAHAKLVQELAHQIAQQVTAVKAVHAAAAQKHIAAMQAQLKVTAR